MMIFPNPFFFYWQGKEREREKKLGGEMEKSGKESPQTLIPTALLVPLPAPSFLSH